MIRPPQPDAATPAGPGQADIAATEKTAGE
jgi:hypothetical protein